MDIDILLGLQEFRNGAGAFLAEFLSKMTFMGELNTAILIMAVIYWCFSKETGVYMLMGWCGNRLVNGALKITACVYRPWIRDPRVIPYGDSMTTATGYSFPSGHSMNASAVFGGGALKKDLPRILRIILGLILLLVMFSRCYLGVHTPQDVLVGGLAGVLVMWLTMKLMKYLSAHPEKDFIVLIIGIALAAGLAVFAKLKSYPADYDAEGKLLVDGAKMANDTFKAVGWCAAFLIGWILEKRFVKFPTEVSVAQRITRLTVGVFGYYIVSLIIMPPIKEHIEGPAGTIISCFLQMFYVAFLFPLLMKLFEKDGSEASEKAAAAA